MGPVPLIDTATAVPPYRRTAVPPYRRTALPPYQHPLHSRALPPLTISD